MKGIKYILLALVGALVLTSCSTKQKALNDMRGFTRQLELKSDNYGLEDWKQAAGEYAKLNRKLTKYSYNPEQMEEIGELQGQCLSTFLSAMKTKAQGWGSFIKGVLEGLE